MAFLANLRAWLLEDSTLSTLIGTRLYPETLPQSPTLPAATYNYAGGERFHSLSGAIGLAGPRVQFDAWAATALETDSVAEALRGALDSYRGDIGGSPPTQTIQGIFLLNEWSGYEPGAEQGTGSGVGLYRRSADYLIFYEETP